jgi:catechol 2,3-dioxygenase
MSRHEGPTHTSAPPKLPATLRLGAVHLSVSDLERSVDFYEDAIGLRLPRREDGVAAMGVGEEDYESAPLRL